MPALPDDDRDVSPSPAPEQLGAPAASDDQAGPDSRAWDQLRRGAIRSARFVVGAASDRDDTVQEALVRLIQNGACSAPNQRAPRLIRGTARNVARERWRRRARFQRALEQGTVAARLAEPPAATVAERAELSRVIDDAVRALPNDQYNVIRLRYFDQLSSAEIADLMGVSTRHVSSLNAQATARLKADLERRYGRAHPFYSALALLARLPTARRFNLGSRALLSAAGVTLALAVLALAVPVAWSTAAADAAAPLPASSPDSLVSAQQPVEGAPSRAVVEPDTRALASAGECRIVGRVVSATGQPAAALPLTLLSYSALHGFFVSDPLEPAAQSELIRRTPGRTGPDGRFAIEAPFAVSHSILVVGIGTSSAQFAPLDITPAYGQRIDLGDVHLEQRGSVSGQVVDQDDQPLRDVEVWATDLPAAALLAVPLHHLPTVTHVTNRRVVYQLPTWCADLRRELALPTTRTNDDGRFALEGVPGGTNVILVSPRDRPGAWRSVKVDVGRSSSVGTISVDEPRLRTVRVIDAAQVAVAGAEVLVGPRPIWADRFLEFDLLSPVGVTGDDGRLTVAAAPNTALSVAVRRNPDHPWTIAAASRTGPVEVRLPPEQALRLRVRSSEGEAIPSARFRLVAGDAVGDALVCASLASRLGEVRPEGVELAVPAGRYTLIAQAPGHAIASQVIDVTGPRDYEIVLRREAKVRVVVRDAYGAPVTGAAVYVRADQTPAWARPSLALPEKSIERWWPVPRLAGRTDAQGSFVLTGETAGPAWLTVAHSAYGPVSVPVGLEPGVLPLRLDRVNRVHGRVTYGDRPIPAGMALVFSPDRRFDSGAPLEQHSTTPDATGAFEMPGLPAGPYMVGIRPCLQPLKSVGAVLTRHGDHDLRTFKARHRIEVTAGEALFLALDLAASPGSNPANTVAIGGLLTVNGRTTEPMFVRITSEHDPRWDPMTNGSDAEVVSGRFRIDGLPPYPTYWIAVKTARGAGHLWARKLDYSGTSPLRVDVNLTTVAVAGRFLGARGEPLGGTALTFRGSLTEHGTAPDDHSEVTTRPDAHGTWRIEHLVPGRYRATALGLVSDEFAVTAATGELTVQMHELDGVRHLEVATADSAGEATAGK